MRGALDSNPQPLHGPLMKSIYWPNPPPHTPSLDPRESVGGWWGGTKSNIIMRDFGAEGGGVMTSPGSYTWVFFLLFFFFIGSRNCTLSYGRDYEARRGYRNLHRKIRIDFDRSVSRRKARQIQIEAVSTIMATN